MLTVIRRRIELFIELKLMLSIIILFIVTPEILLAGVSNNINMPHAIGGPKSNHIAWVICNVIKELTGPIGQSVSTVAVIFIGIGLFMGKISWGLALGVAVGMGMLFGAENVVNWISGSDFSCADIARPF